MPPKAPGAAVGLLCLLVSGKYGGLGPVSGNVTALGEGALGPG